MRGRRERCAGNPRVRGAVVAACLFALCAWAGATTPPGNPSAAHLKQAAVAAVAAGKAAPAMRALTAALRADPNWKEGLWDFGTLLYEAHDIPNALRVFARLTQLDPKHGAPWAMLGICDFEARNFGMSFTHIQEGRSLGLPNANLQAVALYDEAQDLLMLEEFPQAQHLLRGFALNHRTSPGIVQAFGLAALHIPLLPDQLKGALPTARRHLVETMGVAMFDMAARKLPAAQTVMAGILRSSADVPYVQYSDGVLLSQMGRLAAARAAFQRELKVEPRNVPAHLELAALCEQNAHYRRAMNYAREALSLAPGNFATHYMVGFVLFRQGQYAAAARQLQRAKDLAPDDSQVRYTLAQADLRLHRTQAALREEKAFRRLEQLTSSFRNKGVLPASVYLHSQPHSGTP
jgi:tetratricopeptide (TPR) repeat protein